MGIGKTTKLGYVTGKVNSEFETEYGNWEDNDAGIGELVMLNFAFF
jgi:hypothetical protein